MEHAGLLNVFKPSGVSSFWVVKQVRRILRVKKAGHCGTLDPLAEGVLLVLFGKATRLQENFMGQRKVYRTRVLLGTTTDTGDVTGKVIERREVPPVPAALLENILSKFTGEIEQVPPMYSALKHQGRKLYELAREGIEVERKARKVTVYALEQLSFDGLRLELRVSCSRGTYIRTLAEDIGRELGCGATMEYLCREKVGEFDIASAVPGATLHELEGHALLSRALSLETLQASLAQPGLEAAGSGD